MIRTPTCGSVRYESSRKAANVSSVPPQVAGRYDGTGVARGPDLTKQPLVVRAPVQLVIEHQQLWPRARGESGELGRGRMRRCMITLPILWPRAEAFGRVHLVNQHVTAAARAYDGIARAGVARDHDGPSATIEPVPVGNAPVPVRNGERAHDDVGVPIDDTRN